MAAQEIIIGPDFSLQPKQWQLYELTEGTGPTVLGIGGGRGGAKTGGLQRIMLTRCFENPGTVRVIVMRNSDQIQRYHEDVIKREYPELIPCYRASKRKFVFPMPSGPPSELLFMYAETLADVIRCFRSANFYDVAVDQAEQFTEAEVTEISQAVRWKGVPKNTCKLLLSFNIGGVGIDYLRRVFHLKDFRQNERPEDYAFIHVRPYDNAQWSLDALAEDGLTQEDYYGWTDAQRQNYCATRSDYGRKLVSKDPAIVKRDWDGAWDSLEGAFFSRVFDRDKAVLSPAQASKLIKPWSERFLAMDWGRGHWCPTLWNARCELSPEDAKKILGWDVKHPLKIVVTYREYIAGGAAAADEGGDRELSEQDMAHKIVEKTPQDERATTGAFFLSPDAFAKRTSKNTIAQDLGDIFVKNGMPYPRPADNSRVNGWALLSNMMLETKRQGENWENIWFISADCAELIAAIPMAMRDPKNLDDILKTTKISDDLLDCVRYAMQSMLSPGKKPKEEEMEEKLAKYKESGLDENSLWIYRQRLEQEIQKANTPSTIGRRAGTIRRIGR